MVSMIILIGKGAHLGDFGAIYLDHIRVKNIGKIIPINRFTGIGYSRLPMIIISIRVVISRQNLNVTVKKNMLNTSINFSALKVT